MSWRHLPHVLTLAAATAGLLVLVGGGQPAAGRENPVGTGQALPARFQIVAPGLATGVDHAISEGATEGQVVREPLVSVYVEPGDIFFQSPLIAFTGVTDRYGMPRGLDGYHTGLDFGLDRHRASPVFASCAGVVTEASFDPGYGDHVILDCGGGWTTLYGHLSLITVQVGDSLSRGMQLGVSGSTGVSTGEHVHFEIRKNGAPLNPELYIDLGLPPLVITPTEVPTEETPTPAVQETPSPDATRTDAGGETPTSQDGSETPTQSPSGTGSPSVTPTLGQTATSEASLTGTPTEETPTAETPTQDTPAEFATLVPTESSPIAELPIIP